MGAYGIDISEHNGNINLKDYKRVIIRAGWGIGYVDKKFERNVKECEKLGIAYGVYWYSYATNVSTALKEVKTFLETIKGRNITLGVWLDMEDADGWKRKQGWRPTKRGVSDIVVTYCNAIQNAGWYTGVYLSYSWLQYLDSNANAFDKWVAHWGPNDGSRHGDYSKIGSIHQFTSKPLDRDYFYKLSYPNKKATKPVEDLDAKALKVLRGEYGNGEARKKALGSDYARVQARVNEILRLARNTMEGKYGNGAVRKKKLGANYKVVQEYINYLAKVSGR